MKTKQTDAGRAQANKTSLAGEYEGAPMITLEHVEFIEKNWNYGKIVQTIYKDIKKSCRNVESTATAKLIEILIDRKELNSYQIGTIAGELALEAYSTGLCEGR